MATENKMLVLNLNETVSNEEMLSLRQALVNAFPSQSFTDAENRSVSSYFSQEFMQKAITALILSAAFIILFVWFRFRKIHGLSAGVMALLALLHDVVVVFIAFVIFNMPVGDSFVAVALMILGYSLSDTIVIYDRIREYATKDKKATSSELVNRSVSHNLTRSINTSVTVFATMLIVYIFATLYGLDSIRAFAMPMCLGTASGCYSSVCLASPTWALWQNRKQKRLEQKKADAKKPASKK
jgi:preprotein translocase SecF subunit